MTDDDFERLRAEVYRRVDAKIEALKAVRDAEASGDADAISEAKEAVWQARLAHAELAIGDEVRVRMKREIAHLDNQPDDPATNHRRRLMMLGRFSTTAVLGLPDLLGVATADTVRQLEGKEGQVLRPVDTGPGQKGFDPIDLNLIRRYVLRVIVERWRTGAKNKNMKQFLSIWPHAPGYDQFRGW